MLIGYADWFDTELGHIVWQDERAALLSLIAPVAGRAVLDASIAAARLVLDLEERGAQVTGVDASHAMLRLAARRAEQAGARLPPKRRKPCSNSASLEHLRIAKESWMHEAQSPPRSRRVTMLLWLAAGTFALGAALVGVSDTRAGVLLLYLAAGAVLLALLHP